MFSKGSHYYSMIFENIYLHFLDMKEDLDLEIVNVEDDDDEPPPPKKSFTDIKPAPLFLKARGYLIWLDIIFWTYEWATINYSSFNFQLNVYGYLS